MNFEERLLMELKTEIASRGEAKRRRSTPRRLLAAAAVAGIAAAAVITVPFLTGSETPASAVTENADGTVTLKLNEFRNPDQVEADLAKLGVTADISYVKPGTRCHGDRGKSVPTPSFTPQELKSKDPKVRKWITETMLNSQTGRAIKSGIGGIQISPKYIKPGQTAVIEIVENDDQTSGPEKPRVVWKFGGLLIDGPVKPCRIIEDPNWDKMPDPKKHPEAYPPVGS
jgi:hypothetical protein